MEKNTERVHSSEELVELMKEVATEAIGETPYVHSKVAGWNNAIVEGCLRRLKEKDKKHKYVVTCVIIQKKGNGFYAGSSVFWDNDKDASGSYVYETKSLFAVLNTFALSL